MKIKLLNKVLILVLLLGVAAVMISCGSDDDDPTPTPTPTEPIEPPVTHVYSEEASSEAVVKEVRADGTVVLDASTAKEIPEKDEIIVSGITDAAPEGFLYRVEKVRQQNGEIIVETREASLNEVLPDAHINQPLQFRLADDAMAPKLRSNGRNAAAKLNEAELLNFKQKFEIKEWPGGKFEVLGTEVKESVKATVDVGMKLKGDFIWDSGNFWPKRVGIKLDGELSLSATVEAAIKAKYEKKFAETPLEPIAFLVGPVPVVIVPTIQWKFGVRSAEGKIYAKWKPVDIDAWKFDTHLIWNKEANYNGENWDYGFDTSSDFTNWSWNEFFIDMANAEIGLSGDVKFSVWPEMRFKLYNSESVSLALGISPYAKVAGDLAVKYQLNSGLNDVLDDFEVKDNLSVSVGLDVPLEGKVLFKTPWGDIGGTKGTSLTLLDKALIQGGFLFPVFNDFTIYPEDDAKLRDNVHVSAYKGARVISIFADNEIDYGFCISEVKKQSNGLEMKKDWKYYSLKSKYQGQSYGLDGQFKMEMDIPTANMLENATYEIRPYTTLKFGSKTWTLERKGGKFKTGGSGENGSGVIIDVPGNNF